MHGNKNNINDCDAITLKISKTEITFKKTNNS